MAANSEISWCHHTFNPTWGCHKVSEGCDNCYAETFAKRVGQKVWGSPALTERRTFGDAHWAEPLKWDRDAAKAGERRRVFCASMADVFEAHTTVDNERQRLWRLIQATPNLDWLLLTKRPERIATRVPWALSGEPWPNVWLGTSTETQEWADKRIPHLLKVPAAVRFISAEPLLGPIDLSRWLLPTCEVCQHRRGRIALDDEVGLHGPQQRDRVTGAVDFPPSDRFPAMSLGAGVVPTHEPAEVGLKPLNDLPAGAVDGEPRAIGPISSAAPIEVPLAVKQPRQITERSSVLGDDDGLWPEVGALAADGGAGSLQLAPNRAPPNTDFGGDGIDGEPARVRRGDTCACDCHALSLPHSPALSWVIAGGESGPKHRPFDPDWARSLRDQCQAAGVAFHFKQHGGLHHAAGGRLLDGREWLDFPTPRLAVAR